MVHCTDTGEIEQDIDQNDKTSPLKHFLIVALKKKEKKKQNLLPFFQTFPVPESFKTFPRIQDSVRTPGV